MKSFVLVVLLIFCVSVKSQAQNDWQIELGVAVVKIPKENIEFVGDQYLYQIPRLSATYTINERFSISGAISFNTIKKIGTAENDTNYFSVDSFLRYSLIKDSHFLNPYVFVGASLVSVNINFTPAINVGFGNTFWVLKNLGINGQAMYKISQKNISHFQITAGFIYNVSSGRKNLWDK